jgi:L-ascorbate metabolism protein UlaG (beta-lactamase superfamily)
MSSIHISPEEAVKVHLDVNAELSIGMHFGTFPLADDGQDRPQNELKAALKEHPVNEEEFILLEEGQSLSL